jgi:hypothetical protein
MAGKKACAHIGRRKAREKSQKKKKVTEERECGEKGMDPVIRRKSLGWPLCGFFFSSSIFEECTLQLHASFTAVRCEANVVHNVQIKRLCPDAQSGIYMCGFFYSALLGKVVSFTYWRESSLFRKHH